LKKYKPDFVVYPKCDAKRLGPLSGEGVFIEVKWNYEKNFEDHQWMALLFHRNSIVASLNEPTESEWKAFVRKKSLQLQDQYPALKHEDWLVNAENHIEHYHIKSSHFRDWTIRNIGLLVNSQLNIGRKRYWLMLMSKGMKKNWDRMMENHSKRPFWAWVNEGMNLTELMKMKEGDEIMFLEAKSVASGRGRWGNKVSGKDGSDKQLEKLPYQVKGMYHLSIQSRTGKSGYHCHLGDDEISTFFEDCTNNCKHFGCNGCGRGVKRSMNNVQWPHFVRMKIIGSIHEPKEWKELLRGKLGRRLGSCGSAPNTPAELTDDEFNGLRGKILAEKIRP